MTRWPPSFAGAGCQRSDHLARALVTKVRQYELGTVRAERVRRIDEDPSVPRRQASKCVLDIRPGDSEQDIVKARCLRGRGGRCTVAEFGGYVGKGVRAVPVAQHHLMASLQGFSRESERDGARTDRSEPHDAAPRSLEKLKRTTPFRPGRPTCATASPIRDGGSLAATSNSDWGSSASRCA